MSKYWRTASIEMLIRFGVLVKDKQKGKNHDLSVAEYKVQQETKRLDIINVLDKLKAILYKLLSMIPVVREFAKLVEEERDIRAASPYGYTPLGRLLREYRTPLPPPGMTGLSSFRRLPRGRLPKGKWFRCMRIITDGERIIGWWDSGMCRRNRP